MADDVRNNDGDIPTVVPKTHVEHIRFDNVSLLYEQGKQQPKISVLKDVSLDWENQKLGLVGVSGEGKSSIIKMFIAEVVPTNGYILVDGIEYSSFSRRFVNSHFNILHQDVEIFNTDLDWNLTLNREVISADRKSETITMMKTRAQDVITDLYNTTSGRRRK